MDPTKNESDADQTHTINFKLLKAQRQFVRFTKRINAFVGGFGSGKSRALAVKATIRGFQNAPCVGIFVEPTYPMVRDIAWETFRELYDEHGISYDLNKTNHSMVVEDEFQILFRSGEEPGRLIGINAGWAALDEPARQDEQVPKMLLGRIRDPRAQFQELFMGGTPEGFNWFHQWVTNPDLGMQVVRAKTFDNPYLRPEYIEYLKKMYTEEEFEAYVNGEFIQFRGAWYKKMPLVYPALLVCGGLVKQYIQPREVKFPIIGCDTAGGLGRDSSAIAVIDGATGLLAASWTSKVATIDEMCAIISMLYEHYTRRPAADEWGEAVKPTIVVEVDGIGKATQQTIERQYRLPVVVHKTRPDNRYRGLLLAKRGVESGRIFGPEELLLEAQNLVVEEQKYYGPKDLSMSIGFALLFLEENPYKGPQDTRDKNRFDLARAMRKKKRRG